MAGKPTVRIIAVDKSDKSKKVELFHGWNSEGKYGGYSLKLSRENTYQGTTKPGVAKIVLTDGRVITPDTPVFFNVQVYSDAPRGDSEPFEDPKSVPEDGIDDDQIPF